MALNHFFIKWESLLWFLGAFFICFLGVSDFPISILDEAKNSEAAREMWLSKQWFSPTFNGELRTDKPPLPYFFMQLGYEIFGANNLGARFFSAFSGALTFWVSYFFTRRHLGKEISRILMMVFLASTYFILEFHLAVPDPYLIFFITLGLFNLYDFSIRKKTLNLLVFYIAIGLAVLSKGLVAIFLPGLIALIYIGLKDGWKFYGKYYPLLGGLLVIIISFPWFYMAHLETDGLFTEGFFMKHHLGRFSEEMEGHGGGFWITWLFVLLGLIPFGWLIFPTIIQIWKSKRNSLAFFSLVVVLCFVGFFSISATKLPNYAMPAFPFALLLISSKINHWIEENRKKPLSFLYILWLILGLLMIPAAMMALLTLDLKSFTLEEVLSRWKYHRPKVLFDLAQNAWFLLVIPLGSMVALWMIIRKNIYQSFVTFSISWILFGAIMFKILLPKIGAHSAVLETEKLFERNEQWVVYKSFDPAFCFNHERTFNIHQTEKELQAFFEKNPNGLVLTKWKYFEELSTEKYHIIYKKKTIFENYYTLVFKRK